MNPQKYLLPYISIDKYGLSYYIEGVNQSILYGIPDLS